MAMQFTFDRLTITFTIGDEDNYDDYSHLIGEGHWITTKYTTDDDDEETEVKFLSGTNDNGNQIHFIIPDEHKSKFAIMTHRESEDLFRTKMFATFGSKHETKLYRELPKALRFMTAEVTNDDDDTNDDDGTYGEWCNATNESEGYQIDEYGSMLQQPQPRPYGECVFLDDSFPTSTPPTHVPVSWIGDINVMLDAINRIENMARPFRAKMGESHLSTEVFRLLRNSITHLHYDDPSKEDVLMKFDRYLTTQSLHAAKDGPRMPPQFSSMTWGYLIAPVYLYARLMNSISTDGIEMDEETQRHSIEVAIALARGQDPETLGRDDDRKLVSYSQLWTRKKSIKLSGISLNPLRRTLQLFRSLNMNTLITTIEEKLGRADESNMWCDLTSKVMECFVFDFVDNPMWVVRANLEWYQFPGLSKTAIPSNLLLWEEAGVVCLPDNRCANGCYHKIGRYCSICRFFPIEATSHGMETYAELLTASSSPSKRVYATALSRQSVQYIGEDGQEQTLPTMIQSGDLYTKGVGDTAWHHPLKACLSVTPGNESTLHDWSKARTKFPIIDPHVCHLIMRNGVHYNSMTTGYGEFDIVMLPTNNTGTYTELLFRCVVGIDGSAMITEISDVAWDMIQSNQIIVRTHTPSILSKEIVLSITEAMKF